MKPPSYAIKDANEAVASVAYRLSENIAIYPITPSSPMAEWCDEWASVGRPNLWGTAPSVVQMQSEGGVAGAMHGTLTGGTLSTTFTASQGLLLMIPNLYKIAGELTPFCFHVTARSLATHALSIFGDHSDVMACRQTGCTFVCSNTVQEAQDLAAICHMLTLVTRVPVLHFFDGFRTSHEVNTFEPLEDEILRKLLPEDALVSFYKRSLTPDKPSIRGTAQNPDVFFQGREAANPYYDSISTAFEELCTRFAELTGRSYHACDYFGDPEAEDVVIAMGSGVETCRLVSGDLNKKGRKTGVLAVRLFRPFSIEAMVKALPASVKRIAVLDRTKEPGALGEPLYQDIVTALAEAGIRPERVLGGRYGLGSKEFDPPMAKAVFDHLCQENAWNHFTVGINDDVSRRSLKVDESYWVELPGTFNALFYGLGADGTVGANKNTIKIIGEETSSCAQAYFVYDSKKSGAMTVSHLRFGPNQIEAPFLVKRANFVGVHQWSFVQKMDILSNVAPGGTVLFNSPYKPEDLWAKLPLEARRIILERNLKLYTIDAYTVARECGMGGRINTIMQTSFFAISGVLPPKDAIHYIKESIRKTYGKKGDAVVKKNYEAVDATLAYLNPVPIGKQALDELVAKPALSQSPPDFVQRVTMPILRGEGDRLPVSALPADGVWPSGTSRWEKRAIATEIPVWDSDMCIQCGRCSFVCPHAAIRAKVFSPDELEDAPAGYPCTASRIGLKDKRLSLYTLQVSPDDCTGCNLCVEICPIKDKENPKRKAINMESLEPISRREQEQWNFFERLPEVPTDTLGNTVKDTQFRQPLFEFSGACAGCGETPYVKLLTQLVGDRLMIANATGCSSIYGGNLPTTPYTMDRDGRGPAWSNSLFEDNAEFALGLRLAVDKKTETARYLLEQCSPYLEGTLVREILVATQEDDLSINAQRDRVAKLKRMLHERSDPQSKRLLVFADYLVRKSVWALGGDGWAYDIGFGGLDHVIASGRNVKIMVLDTEVYSNTGGQASKSTPKGAIAKFASSGKMTAKKDLGLIAMGYGNAYVASVSLGSNERQLIQAMTEAESYDGPALIIAYSHCIAHGFPIGQALDHHKHAVNSGHWPLYRYDPRLRAEGKAPLQLDSKPAKESFQTYADTELRYRMLAQSDPAMAARFMEAADQLNKERRELYEALSKLKEAEPEMTACGTNSNGVR